MNKAGTVSLPRPHSVVYHLNIGLIFNIVYFANRKLNFDQ